MAQLTQPDTATRRGVVVSYYAERGYGFIRPLNVEADGRNVYVHISDVAGRKLLHPGQRVTYRVEARARGPAAVEVQLHSLLTVPELEFSLVGLGVAAISFFSVGMGLDWPNTPGAWLGLWMLSASVASSGLFYMDKHRARAGGERVPEIVLKGSMLCMAGRAGSRGCVSSTTRRGNSAPCSPTGRSSQ
jgi:cold shock CspA family protein